MQSGIRQERLLTHAQRPHASWRKISLALEKAVDNLGISQRRLWMAGGQVQRAPLASRKRVRPGSSV